MIPSHTKVAWAFLDKLLGRTPPAPDLDPLTMTMGQRNRILDESTQQMAFSMDKELRRFARDFSQQVNRVAAGYDLDPRAVFWILMQPRQRWPKMPHNQRRWLDVGASAAAVYGEVPSMLGRISYSSKIERLVGSAFLELARWVHAEVKTDLERAYLQVLQREARGLMGVYTYPNQPVPTLPKVTLALMHEFEWRLEHAKLMVGSANLMERIFRLFT